MVKRILQLELSTLACDSATPSAELTKSRPAALFVGICWDFEKEPGRWGLLLELAVSDIDKDGHVASEDSTIGHSFGGHQKSGGKAQWEQERLSDK